MVQEAKKQNTTDNKQDGISEGRVAQIQSELAVTGVFNNMLTPQDASSGQNQPEKIKSVNGLTHLTQSRPAMPHRRPPTRQPRRKNQFFSETKDAPALQILPQPSNHDLLDKLKRMISRAESNYKANLGWASWWFYGDNGQSEVDEISTYSQKAETVDLLVDKIDVFFQKSNTRYDNYSFAACLLNEFYSALELGVVVPGTSYDNNSWLTLHAELKQLTRGEEKENTYKPG